MGKFGKKIWKEERYESFIKVFYIFLIDWEIIGIDREEIRENREKLNLKYYLNFFVFWMVYIVFI